MTAPPHSASPPEVAEAFRAAWNRADATALAEVFTEDADFINVVGFWWHGRDQIRFNHAIGFRDMFPDTTMVYEKTRVRDLGPGHAVVIARWRMSGQQDKTTDSRGGVRRGVLTFVVTRSDAGWRAVSAHNTDIIPGAQTHLVSGSGQIDAVNYRGR